MAVAISTKQVLALIHLICNLLLGHHAVSPNQLLQKLQPHFLQLLVFCSRNPLGLQLAEAHGEEWVGAVLIVEVFDLCLRDEEAVAHAAHRQSPSIEWSPVKLLLLSIVAEHQLHMLQHLRCHHCPSLLPPLQRTQPSTAVLVWKLSFEGFGAIVSPGPLMNSPIQNVCNSILHQSPALVQIHFNPDVIVTTSEA